MPWRNSAGQDNRRDPRYLPWIVLPAVLAGLALVLWLTGGAEVGWWRLAVAVGVPVLIAAVSKAIAWFYRRRRRSGRSREASRRQGPCGGARTSEASAPSEPGDLPSPIRAPDRDGMPSLGHRPRRGRNVRAAAPQPERVASVRTAGDALAVAVVAVTGLGLVRSFTAPALPGVGRDTAVSGIGVGPAVAIGIVVATVSWPLANGPVRKRPAQAGRRGAGR